MMITNGGGGGGSKVDCNGSGKQVAQCDQPEGNKPKGKAVPPIVEISPHVYDSSSDPQLSKLRQAWEWVKAKYGAPRNAGQEFNDWWHACNGPYSGACRGAFGADFRQATPNFAVETAWWSGIKLGLGHGGNIEGYFLPLLAGGVASSKILAKNLVLAGYDPPDDSAAHHIVAGTARPAQAARDVLDQFEVGINSSANGVWLPADTSSANPYGAAVHSKVHTNRYYESVNDRVRVAQSQEELTDILQDIRTDLLGMTPGSDDGGAAAGGE